MARLCSAGLSLTHANSISLTKELSDKQSKFWTPLFLFLNVIGRLQAGCKESKTVGSAELEKFKLQTESGRSLAVQV